MNRFNSEHVLGRAIVIDTCMYLMATPKIPPLDACALVVIQKHLILNDKRVITINLGDKLIIKMHLKI